MTVKIEMTAFQEGVLRLLAAEIKEWNLEEVLNATEALRIRLGLKTEQLQAAICGEFEVVIIIAGGIADRDAVLDAKERFDANLEKMADEAEEADRKAGIGFDFKTDTQAAIDEAMKIAAELNITPARLTAREFLLKGLGHMEDRAAEYDNPEGERSMAATVEAFNAITECDLSETEGWLFMSLLKMVRSQQGGPFKADNYEDLAAYAGLAGEAAAKHQRLLDMGMGECA